MRHNSLPLLVCVAVVVLLLLAGLTDPTIAGTDSPAPAAEAGRDWNATIGLDFGSFLSTRSLLTLGLSGVAAAWSWDETDETIGVTQDQLSRSRLDPLFDLGNAYGSGWVIGGGSVTLLAVGQATNNDNLNAFGGDLLRSFLYSGAATWIFKYSVNRTRPSGGPYSFPSGHTASAFSTVPVVWHHLGWAYGVGAGTLSVLAGLGRMEEGKHYLSDVIVGAALGVVVGWAVIDHRRQTGVPAHVAVGVNSVTLSWRF